MALIVMCDGCGKWTQLPRDFEEGLSRFPEGFRAFLVDRRCSDADPLRRAGSEMHVCSSACATAITERMPVVQIKRVDTSIT